MFEFGIICIYNKLMSEDQLQRNNTYRRNIESGNTIPSFKLAIPRLFNEYENGAIIPRNFQHGEISDYFNYGFNQSTLKAYINKVKLNKILLKNSLKSQYQMGSSRLSKLDSQIPMDLGGFGNFLDKSLLQNSKIHDLESDALFYQFLNSYEGSLPKYVNQFSQYINIDDIISQIFIQLQQNIARKNQALLNSKDQNIYQKVYALHEIIPFQQSIIPAFLLHIPLKKNLKYRKRQNSSSQSSRSDDSKSREKKKRRKDKKIHKQYRDNSSSERQRQRKRYRQRQHRRRQSNRERHRYNERRMDRYERKNVNHKRSRSQHRKPLKKHQY